MRSIDLEARVLALELLLPFVLANVARSTADPAKLIRGCAVEMQPILDEMAKVTPDPKRYRTEVAASVEHLILSALLLSHSQSPRCTPSPAGFFVSRHHVVASSIDGRPAKTSRR